MTKRALSKYKRIRQFYIDLWSNGKKNVKVLKKVFLLNAILQLIEEKKNLLRKAGYRSKRKIFTKRNIAKTHKKLLSRAEKILKAIPKKYMDRNRKSRIFKYIKRKNQQLFQSRDQLILDLIFILERKRKKPSWRRTKFEAQFRLKHLFQQFYGNLLLKQFRNMCRKNRLFLSTGISSMGNSYKAFFLYSLLESRLDSVLYRANLATTVFACRQLINHGHVLVNGAKVTVSSFVLNSGDIVEVSKKDVSKNLFNNYISFKKSMSLFLIFSQFLNNPIFKKELGSSILRQVLKQNSITRMKLNDCKLDSSFNLPNRLLDAVEVHTFFKKVLFLLKKNSKNLLVNETDLTVLYMHPSKELSYPFEVDISSFKKVINFLSA